MRFDFLLDEYRIFLEIDGDQHFRQVRNWKPPEVVQARDITKMEGAIKNVYSVIRMYQRDVYNNAIQWREILLDIIANAHKFRLTPKLIMVDNVCYKCYDVPSLLPDIVRYSEFKTRKFEDTPVKIELDPRLVNITDEMFNELLKL